MVENANQIAVYFAGFPREEAIAGIQDHIRKFWTRDTQEQLIDYVAKGGKGLHELVLEAVKRTEISA